MAVKVTVVSPGKNRVSINNQDKKEVRTIGLFPSVEGIINSLPNELKKLKDVDASDADTNETLVYDESSGKYVVKELPIINGGTF